MKWVRPQKKRRQPKTGNYGTWKKQVAKDCSDRCVYCAIHESGFGGFRNFHVDHYKPKSKFPALENIIKNLYYACAICNGFKLDDWPEEPPADMARPCYPDPSEVDYNSIFSVDTTTGMLSGVNVAARYMVARLYLNRPQLITERRAFRAREVLLAAVDLAQDALDAARQLPKNSASEALAIAIRISAVINDLMRLILRYQELRPYEPDDIKKPR